MGPLPSSGVMPRKVVVGTLTERDVLDTADANNKAIWNAAHSCQDAQIAQDVYQATLDEKEKGWLSGPYTLKDLPKVLSSPGASASSRVPKPGP